MQDDLTLEVWRPVIGWEGDYSISSLGRLRRDAIRRHNLIRRPGQSIDGYVRVTLLSGERRRFTFIHTLVAEAFLGSRPMGHEINHKDTNKANNRVDNLEWATPLVNTRHAIAAGRWNHKGTHNGRAKLNDEIVADIRSRVMHGETRASLARLYGVDPSVVSLIASNKSWH